MKWNFSKNLILLVLIFISLFLTLGPAASKQGQQYQWAGYPIALNSIYHKRKGLKTD